MNIPYHAKITKLIKNLARNPDLIIPYLRTSIFTNKSPIDFNMPWWSFRAIDRADELLAGKTIFEFGTGGSTVRYARIAKNIVCVEDDERWGKEVESKLNDESLRNVTILYRPFDFDDPAGFETSSYLLSFDGNENHEVVIIDGQDKTFKERIACFKHVEPLMPDGGIVIVDDFWRYTELLESNRAKHTEVYESVGPCRIGVTSTAFFFY